MSDLCLDTTRQLHFDHFMSQLNTKSIICRAEYNNIIFSMNSWSSMSADEKKLNKKVYNWKKQYELKTIIINDELHYILHKKAGKRIVHDEEVFDIIADYHEQNGHKKARSMWNCLKDTYSNISESICHLFVETCPICQQVPAKKPQHKGAKNPIRSNHFRDRIQADLIDYRSDPKDDHNNVTMKWLLVVKDHYTKFTYLRAIRSKQGEVVACELDHLSGFIGFPLTFHTDNGGEFTSSLVVEMIKSWNKECKTVTGRPRTPKRSRLS
jgi:hypothetical protein